MPLKILFIGDVVGSPGRKIVCQTLPRLIPRWGIGLVVCNAENAAGGSGLTLKCFEELAEAGVDVMTMGDHVYRKDEIHQIFVPGRSPDARDALADACGAALGLLMLQAVQAAWLKPRTREVQ